MKKIYEYLYVFSKLSTSFILLACLISLGYFFYISFEGRDGITKDELEISNKINNNGKKISEILKKITFTDTILNEIKANVLNNDNQNNSKEIVKLNNKINELFLKIETISENLEKTQNTKQIKNNHKGTNEKSSMVSEENKKELINLVILKFENNLDYSEELNFIEKINTGDKKYVFEKINLLKFKNFRGSNSLKNIFSQELDIFLKENFNKYSENFISKSIMNFIEVRPSSINSIKNEDVGKLKEIINDLEEKKYQSSYKKITNITNYEKYFTQSLNQIKIAIQFKELLKEVM